MLFLSLGAWFGISLSVLALTGLLVAFIVVGEHRDHDPERAIAELTYRLRHPWWKVTARKLRH